MKRTGKSILSILLTMMLVLTLLPVTVQAAGIPDTNNSSVLFTYVPDFGYVPALEFYFTAMVRDAAGEPVTGLVYTDFTISTSGGTVPTTVTAAQETADGVYNVTATHDTAETFTITVSAEGIPIADRNMFVINLAGGCGTEDDPYRIASADQLATLNHKYMNEYYHYILTDDIDLSDYGETYDDGKGWASISASADSYPFDGYFDGAGYTISNLYVNRPDDIYAGLFGWTDGATIKNVQLETVNVAGQMAVGGLVGFLDDSTIENVSVQVKKGPNDSTIQGLSYVGGLAGLSQGAVIRNSSVVGYYGLAFVRSGSHGNGNGNGMGGGLVGFQSGGVISGCYTNISTYAGKWAGGLVGYSTGSINNCYSKGLVTGMYSSDDPGGPGSLAGWGFDINNCYAAGPVETNGLTCYGKASNSFWDDRFSENPDSEGGADGTGLNTVDMEYYGTFYNAGWDFIGETANGTDDIWGIDEYGEYNLNGSVMDNDGYPFLAWQGFEHRVACDITAFSFDEQIVPAVIDDDAGTIAVEVAQGTDPANLTAVFTLSRGATVRRMGGKAQESGVTANNFTNPVTYTVTAVDGTTTKNWTVTVTVASLPFMSGSVTIDGSAKYGETLTADISGVTYTPDTGGDVPTFQWKRSETDIPGATASTYTLTLDDIGETITVTVTADGVHAFGSVSASAGTVQKLDGPAAPAAPVLVSKTCDTVVLEPNEGHEFFAGATARWQDSNVFTDLLPEMDFNFWIRVKETATRKASPKSDVLTVITDAAPAFVPVTSITGVPTEATEGVDLTLNGTVHPAYTATNKTIVWSVQDAGTTSATISGNTLSTAAAGTVTVRATITNGLTESSDYTQDFTITINAAPVINATLSPVAGSFDLYNFATDIETTVTWNDATGITDVKAGGASIGAGNYTVLGNTLALKKEYLAAQSTGSLELSVEFDAGAAATLTINITDSTPPTINPAHRNYDLSNPQDVSTAITWHSTATVTDVVYGSDHLRTPAAYTINDSVLIIKTDYLSGLSPSEGDELDFVITFDTAATATLTVTVVDGYTPSSNADLSSLSVNGTPVSSFEPNVTTYNIELPYGASVATVTVTSSDPNAGYIVTPASSLPGSATVTVTAEDETATRTYTINFTIGAAPTVSVAGITVTGTGGVSSVQVGNTLQMLAEVLPANATDKSVTWSIESGSGATISANGLLTVTAAGTVTVRATANDGSGVYGEKVVTLTAAPPDFVPVTSITGVPTAATAGVNLTLIGTVAPADATYQTIVWSVQDAGTTGATISGSTLSTTAAGTVTVRATITNGLTESSDYTQDFTITVSAEPVTTYTVTFNSRGSVYATKIVNEGESIGSGNWPSNPTRTGYTFGGWYTGTNGSGSAFTSSTAVSASITVYAKWTSNGGGGGGGNSTPSTPTYNADVKAGNGAETTLPVMVNKETGSAAIDIGSQNLTSDGTVITVPHIPGVDTYSAGIPVTDLSTPHEQGTLTLDTDTGSITVPSNMLTGVSGISGNKAEITIGQGDKEKLPEDIKTAIGNKPLVQLTLSIDGKQTDWSNPDAPVTVSIPYKPIAAELENPESIVIWYIDGAGNVVTIPNGHYDPATETVTFQTTHFSDYAVAYNPISFNDVAATAWYNKAVSFIAARGITHGTGNGNYSPEAKLTRGEFIVLMMRAYGIAPDENPADNFSDAGSTYYTGYLAAAKRLGISAGVGSNLYAPGKEVSRQEMFTLLCNALKVIGQFPQGVSGKTLSDFTDAGQIDSWAKEALTLLVETGTIGGNAGKLTPLSTTTRAEMAQVLYNLLGK